MSVATSHLETRPRYTVLAKLLLVLLFQHSDGRNWRDLVTLHNVTADDDLKVSGNQFEIDPFDSGDPPISSQSKTSPNIFESTGVVQPSTSTTKPNTFASRMPTTNAPTTNAPTTNAPTPPTALPNAPTSSQLQLPIILAYPANSETPDRPETGYFNYDTSPGDTVLYGPGYPVMDYETGDGFSVKYANNGWVNVQAPPLGNYYWDEFGPQGWGPWRNVLTDHNMRTNQCGNVGKQSPIDIQQPRAACIEHHQIRTRVSDFALALCV
jgi:hypothetical protein